MLKYLRMGNPHTKALWWFLTVVTVVTFLGGFVFLFGVGLDTTQQARSSGAVAVVDGQRISQQQYQQALLDQRDAFREQYKTEAQGRDESLLEVQAWRTLVNNAIMEHLARRNGVTAFDPEVLLTLRTTPPSTLATLDAFQTNGKFDPQKYLAALRDPSINWAPFEQMAREELPVRKLQERWVASIKLSGPELRQAYQDRFERTALTWVRVPPVSGGNVPTPGESELKQVYERYRGEFAGLAATRLEILALPKPVSPSEVKSVGEQARSLADRARAGEDFATLARSYSEGATADRGGVLDRPVAQNELGPALAPVLPRMKPGDVTDPIQEGNMYYVFRVDSVAVGAGSAPAHYKLSQIVLRVRPDATEQQKLAERLQGIRNRASKAGLGVAASEQGLATQETPFFDANGGPPQLFAVPQVAEWGLTAPLRAVSGLFENDDAYVVAQVIAKRPAGPRPFDEVREQVVALAESEARVDRAGASAQQLAQQLGKGRTLEQAAAALGLPVDHSEPFTRLQPDVRLAGVPEVVGAAFGIPQGGVAGPLRARDGWYFLRVDKRQPPDEQAFETLKGQISSQVLQQKQQQIFASWITCERDQAKVQDLRGEPGLY
jgi:peptidyl-prolyl cis-trans isomerase D